MSIDMELYHLLRPHLQQCDLTSLVADTLDWVGEYWLVNFSSNACKFCTYAEESQILTAEHNTKSPIWTSFWTIQQILDFSIMIYFTARATVYKQFLDRQTLKTRYHYHLEWRNALWMSMSAENICEMCASDILGGVWKIQSIKRLVCIDEILLIPW